MKRQLFVLSVTALLFISGCGVKSYEQQAGLTPLAAPVAVAGAIVFPYPTPIPASLSLRGTAKIAIIEAFIASAKTPKAANSVVEQTQSARAMLPIFSGVTNNPYISQRKKYFIETIDYMERAAVIKRFQLEAGDKNDSTGEVAKYLNYFRITVGNGNTLPQLVQ